MTGSTRAFEDTTVGIGDLSALTDVRVRTIRFYCDEGLLETSRSSGGHRRFDEGSVDRLLHIRQLRSLGLGLGAIADVLNGHRSLAEAVAIERRTLDGELASLAWRRAALHAVELADPTTRAARLELLALVTDGRGAHDELVAFWRRCVVAPLPADTFAMFVQAGVPEPPSDPTPTQVLAYARMVALVRDHSLIGRMLARARAGLEVVADERALLDGVAESLRLAQREVTAGTPPHSSPAADRFVEAHVAVRGARDSPTFRRELLVHVDVDRDPRLQRYWALLGEITGESVNIGSLQNWVLDSVELSVG